MNLKVFFLPLILITLLQTNLSSAEDLSLDFPIPSISCYDETNALDVEKQEALKVKIQSIEDDLKEMTPKKIIQFCKRLETSGNLLDCALAYYSKQYEVLAEELSSLAKENNYPECNILFSEIGRALNKDQQKCQNDALDDDFRINCLEEFYGGLRGTILILKKAVFEGASLQNLYDEAVEVATEDIGETDEQNPSNASQPREEVDIKEGIKLFSTESLREPIPEA